MDSDTRRGGFCSRRSIAYGGSSEIRTTPFNAAQASNCFNWVLRGASASRDAELYDKITFGMPIRILIPSILQVQI